MKIERVFAREIIDSRGNPTVEVDIQVEGGFLGRAAVPSGASTGAYEAHELRDKDENRFLGKGVQKAVNNVNTVIANELIGKDGKDQAGIDQFLNQLDASENKANLGANAILGVSMAVAKAVASAEGKALFHYLGGMEAQKLPVPLMNVLNGGAHANNGLDVQEFMIAPICGGSFKEALRAGCEVFQHLKKILSEKGMSTAVGDEGGFAPKVSSNEEAMQLVLSSIEKAGYKPGDEIKLALDVASTEFYKDGFYQWEGRQIEAGDMIDLYAQWAEEYPLVSIEDGLAEDDWDGWKQLTTRIGEKVQLVGDDLFVTNPKRLQQGIDQGCANALLVKVNQIGSLTETIEAVRTAQKAGYKTVMSHRSGETEDSTISDLSVALHCEQIKTGSLCRGERTLKYNELLRIEETIGDRVEFWGPQAFA